MLPIRPVAATLVAALTLAFSACIQESESDSPPTTVGPKTGGKGGSAPILCSEGRECTCTDGRVGETTCPYGEEGSFRCYCEECNPPFPTGTPEFTPCGGEPFGRWRSVSVDFEGVPLAVGGHSCPMQIVSEHQAMDFRMELRDGGAARVSSRGPVARINIKDGCVYGTACSELIPSGDGSCRKEQCGICTCDITGRPQEVEGTWNRKGDWLTIESDYSDSSIISSYCAKDGQLVFRDPSGMLVTLIPAHFAGTPAPCAQRTTAQCEAGYGCRLGACVGQSKCTGQDTETSCLTYSGCTWDTSKCAGNAESECRLGDYGVVPGCYEIKGQYLGCKGQASCATLSEIECDEVTGCWPEFGP